MKFLKSHGETLVFQINQREKRLLINTLQLYPQLNPDYHRITKQADAQKLESNQQLLEEAMAELRRENRKLVEEFIQHKLGAGADSSGGPPVNGFALTRAQVDWLLEVLNDVRVGSWVKLGQPNQDQMHLLRLPPQKLASFAAMEFSGYLQMVLLEALTKP